MYKVMQPAGKELNSISKDKRISGKLALRSTARTTFAIIWRTKLVYAGDHAKTSTQDAGNLLRMIFATAWTTLTPMTTSPNPTHA
jgi:hypothetical protein